MGTWQVHINETNKFIPWYRKFNTYLVDLTSSLDFWGAHTNDTTLKYISYFSCLTIVLLHDHKRSHDQTRQPSRQRPALEVLTSQQCLCFEEPCVSWKQQQTNTHAMVAMATLVGWCVFTVCQSNVHICIFHFCSFFFGYLTLHMGLSVFRDPVNQISIF